jgi:hypothetical protein
MRGKGGLPMRVGSNRIAVMRKEDAGLTVIERLAKILESRDYSTRLINPADILVELSELGTTYELEFNGDKYQVVLGVSSRVLTPDILDIMGEHCFDYTYSESGHLIHVSLEFAGRIIRLVSRSSGFDYSIVDLNLALKISEIWKAPLIESGIHSFWVRSEGKREASLFELNPPHENYRQRFPLKVNKGTGLVIARKLG